MSAGGSSDGSTTEGSARLGLVWLLADMTLITCMNVLVKASSADYPAIQLVFIRAMIGLVSIMPMIWHQRRHLKNPQQPWRNVARITCNAIALTANFVSLALLPMAMVNALGFSRPLVTMALAVVMLGETVSRMRWLGAGMAFLGVAVMAYPSETAFNVGLLAVLASVVFGALATIQTRMLKAENTTVMMVFYTVGLAVLTAGPALWYWQPVDFHDWGVLLAIGILAQMGQYCWLRAYQSTSASALAPVGYLSVGFAAAAGFIVFDEVPEIKVFIGVALILVALQGTALIERRINARRGKGT